MILACAGLLLAQAVLADRTRGAEPVPAYIQTALADPGRAETDRQLDADRHPAEVTAFAGIKAGDKVADFVPDGGYFTRIFCGVVGETGHVYVIGVTGLEMTEVTGSSCHNVTVSRLKSRRVPAPELHDDSGDPGWVYEYWATSPAVENFAAPEALDVIWISAGRYGELHTGEFGSPDMSRVDMGLLSGLKPGGLLVIEDRVGVREIRREVSRAGFEFVGERKVGGRVVLKFRKP